MPPPIPKPGPRPRGGREAVSLLELLVAAAVAAAVVAVALPAVQKARAAAARTKCQNNLKQVGLGFHAYHAAHGRLPTAVVTYNAPGTDGWTMPATSWAWGALLLPYVGEEPLVAALRAYDAGNGVDETGDYGASSGAADGSKFRSHTATPGRPELAAPVAVYRCPADDPRPTNPLFAYLPDELGRSSYVADRDVLGPDKANVPARRRLADIRDGASSTLVVGERDAARSVGAVWPLATTSTTSGVEGRPGYGVNVGYPGGPPAGDRSAWNGDPCPDCDASTGPPYGGQRYAFASRHAGGVNFLLADGGVRFVADGVEANPTGRFFNFPDTNGWVVPKPAGDADCVLNNLYHPDDGHARTD